MIRHNLYSLARYASVILLLAAFGNLGTIVGQEKPQPETDLTYNYDGAKVQLLGVLVKRKVYGPPGYGETPAQDTRATILVLKLSHAVNVVPLPNANATETPDLDAVQAIREVQLFISSSKHLDSKTFIGSTVAVVGTLHESITASQYTKVWMDVETLTPR